MEVPPSSRKSQSAINKTEEQQKKCLYQNLWYSSCQVYYLVSNMLFYCKLGQQIRRYLFSPIQLNRTWSWSKIAANVAAKCDDFTKETLNKTDCIMQMEA